MDVFLQTSGCKTSCDILLFFALGDMVAALGFWNTTCFSETYSAIMEMGTSNA